MMKYFNLYLMCWLLFSGIATAQNTDAQIASVLATAHQQKSEQPLRDFYEKNEKQLSDYWKAYLLYRKLSLLGTYGSVKNEALRLLGKADIEKAIQLLEKKTDKDAEDWVLLALCESYALNFVAPNANMYQKAMKISNDLDEALSLGKANPRYFLVMGIQDMYTPEMYGGQRKAENYFLQAITLFSKASKDSAVGWGYEDTYQLLVSFYLKKGEKEKAKETANKGAALFPQNEFLKKSL